MEPWGRRSRRSPTRRRGCVSAPCRPRARAARRARLAGGGGDPPDRREGRLQPGAAAGGPPRRPPLPRGPADARHGRPRGVVRGQETRTTRPDKARPGPARIIRAADEGARTSGPAVARWPGFAGVALVIAAALARRIVGGRVPRAARAGAAGLVLDAARERERAPVPHRARGRHDDVAIRDPEHALARGRERAVGRPRRRVVRPRSRRDHQRGLFPTEVVRRRRPRRRRPWRSVGRSSPRPSPGSTGSTTAAGSSRSIGQVPPAEAAARHPAEPEATAWAAASRPTKLPPRSPARFRPLWSSAMTSLTPRKPRSASERGLNDGVVQGPETPRPRRGRWRHPGPRGGRRC